MLYGYLISNIINSKIGPLLYFTLNDKSLFNRPQSLLRETKLQTDEKGGQTYPILGFGENKHSFVSVHLFIKLVYIPGKVRNFPYLTYDSTAEFFSKSGSMRII